MVRQTAFVRLTLVRVSDVGCHATNIRPSGLLNPWPPQRHHLTMSLIRQPLADGIQGWVGVKHPYPFYCAPHRCVYESANTMTFRQVSMQAADAIGDISYFSGITSTITGPQRSTCKQKKPRGPRLRVHRTVITRSSKIRLFLLQFIPQTFQLVTIKSAKRLCLSGG